MNVLIFSKEFPPKVGGAGTYSKNISIGLSEEKHHVTVLTTAMPGMREVEKRIDKELLDRGIIKIKRVKFIPKLYLLRLGLQCNKMIKGSDFDLLLIADSGAQKSAAIVIKQYPIPAWTVFHGSELKNYLRKQSKVFRLFNGKRKIVNFLSKMDGCIAVSKYLADSIKKELPWLKNKLYVVHHGIDTDTYIPNVNFSSNNLRKELELPFDKKIIFTASRLIKKKGQDTLIDMMNDLDDKCGGALLIIAGEGPYEKALKERVNVNNLTEIVLFVGSLIPNEVIKYYQASDLFVLLSIIDESFGLVYIEANACGRAVVGLNIGGVSESIEHNVSGLLVEMSDHEINEKIIDVLNNNEYRESLERRGLERVRNFFNKKQMTENTIKVICKK